MAQEKNLAYLALLSERNKMKKKLAEKRGAEAEIDQRERGFQIHFRGANNNKDSSQKLRVVKPVVSVSQTATSVPLNAPIIDRDFAKHDIAEPPRRGWNVPATVVLGRRVMNVPTSHEAINANGSYLTTDVDNEYEDDFEEDSIDASPPSNTVTSPTIPHQRNNDDQYESAISYVSINSSNLRSIIDRAVAKGGTALYNRTSDVDNGVHICNSSSPMRIKAPLQLGSPLKHLCDENLCDSPSSSSKISTLVDTEVANTVDTFTVKVRLHSTWRDSKFVSLQAIRLLVPAGMSEEDDYEYADICGKLSVELFSGLQELPKSNDSVRTLSSLFQSRKAVPALWKVAINGVQCIDIVMKGTLQSLAPNAREPWPQYLRKCKLLIWNSEINDKCSPAKDVDIFVDNDCLFSGVLNAAQDTLKLDRDTASLILGFDGQVSVAKTKVEKHAPLGTDLEDASVLAPMREGEATGLPSWLKDLPAHRNILQSSFDEKAQFGIVSMEMPSSKALTHETSIAPRTEAVLVNDSIESDATPKLARASRRKILAVPLTIHEGISQSTVGRRDVRQLDINTKGGKTATEDSRVRLSIETIENNDKKIRGRLGRRQAPAGPLSMDNNNGNVDSSKQYVGVNNEGSRSSRIDAVKTVIGKTLAGIEQVLREVSLPNIEASPTESTDVNELQGTVNCDARQSIEAPLDNAILYNEPSSEVDKLEQSIKPADEMESSLPFKTNGTPEGVVLKLEIFSSWGDEYYIGMNGIEIFDGQGQILKFPDDFASISCITNDVTAPADPRVVDNLINGNNYTSDDLQVWLSPFNPSAGDEPVITISIQFSRNVSLSAIRIFNYNKSRTHSVRGVRLVAMYLDHNVIYRGEIRKAPGYLSTLASSTHVIIFTDSSDIVASIAEYDRLAGYLMDEIDREMEQEINDTLENSILTRPRTSDDDTAILSNIVDELADLHFEDAETHKPPMPIASVKTAASNKLRESSSGLLKSKPFLGLQPSDLFYASFIRINISNTWGDLHYAGLCGLQVLEGTECNIVSNLDSISAEPCDLSAIGQYEDPRKLKNLLNGENCTTDDRKMWLIPFTPGGKHYVDIKLTKPSLLAGLRIWNYNKGVSTPGAWEEDVLRGIKRVTLFLGSNAHDLKVLGEYQLRIGPGCDGVDFAQTVYFRDVACCSVSHCPGISHRPSAVVNSVKYITHPIKQDYETPFLPSGMLWRIVLHENWNDGYYIGLDSIKMFDCNGKLLDVIGSCRADITAVPHSLWDLSDSNDTNRDPRIPRMLFQNVYHDSACSDCHGWLAPLSRCMSTEERSKCAVRLLQRDACIEETNFRFPADNSIFVMFQYPVALSAITFNNYSKSPSRGVRHFSIYVDSKLIYMGSLNPADKEAINEFSESKHRVCRLGQTVIFSNDITLVRNEKENVTYCGSTEQDVLCIDERQVIVKSKGMLLPPNAAAEGITADLQNRPTTSFY